MNETVWNPAFEGTYYVGAVADPSGAQEEADEENNVLFGAPLGMGIGADLVISEVTAPVSTERDAPFTSTVTVCNRGTEGASGFVRFYLSPDAELSPWEEAYGASGSVGPLEPGQCATLGSQLLAQVFPEGAWHVGASVESWGWSPELNPGNNTRVSAPMGVGGMADFVVSAITVPSSVNPGEPFTSTVTVCNQGTRAGDTDVKVELVSAPDEQPLRFLDGAYLGMLKAGACVTRDISGFIGSSEQGPLYLRAHADSDGARMELIEDNNIRASEALHLDR